MFEGVCRCKPVSRSRVLRRGGNWNNGPRAGPFASNSNNDASNTNSNTSFRCTSRENTFCPRSLRLLGIVDKGVKKTFQCLISGRTAVHYLPSKRNRGVSQ